MAALGKIRKRGVALVCIIGLGLFAFIAEEAVRSCEATKNQQRQQIGEVLGNKINVQEFQALVDEYQDVLKITQNRDNFSEDELNQIKDQVWSQYVNEQIINNEAEKLGLTVTDEELQNIMKEGTNPMLMQSPFVNQQTGRFDVTMLTKFLDDYKKAGQNPQLAEQYQAIYKYWQFIEKNLRTQTLAQKYQTLLTSCLISNPISAKMAFEGQNTESDIQLASIAYSSINDNDVKVDDKDIKDKYNEKKEMFKQDVESRDIKYVDFQVVASAADRKELMKTMTDAATKLQSGATPAEVVRKAQSQFPYSGFAATKRAYPADIAAKLDSMAVGQTSAVFETAYDNTLNVVKLISKSQQPDSIEYRQIQVGGATAEAAKKTADSIFTALKGGADFEQMAQKYGQTGTKQWLTSAMYEGSNTIDEDSKKYLNTINTLGVNDVTNLEFAQGNIIIQVTNRKAMVDKYDAAVIKHTIDFSKQTYSDAYNKFSQFVSENKTIEDMEKNAGKFGYKVTPRQDVFNYEHNVAGLRSTRETMKWLFAAKAGEVSPLYECGNNDHLLVVALTKVNPVGYRDINSLKDMLKAEVIRDKKFEQIKAKLAGVNDLAAAKAKGARIDSVNQITFTAPVFVQATGASEPALAGAVAATKAGAFSKAVVKGNGGAYLFKVLKKSNREGAKFDANQSEQMLQMQATQAARMFMQELYQKAGVVDNRYLFF
ncbi:MULTISPECIES: SurA N-terminal domain-containing protein [unclassified Prevotella]|uniref:SurA N-terminal domain-containing protein n=1 Tax=unclassified Prevotella TaxID=2638335 RepID=UPI0004901F03|nr:MULTISPECIES: SurA N-terminal domain-containing protein [unclassified Prevotella]